MTASHGGGPDTPAQASSSLTIDEGLGPNVRPTPIPPRPSTDDIESVFAAIARIIDDNEETSLHALLSVEHRAVLTSLHFHDSVGSTVLLERVKAHAAARNYTARRIDSIKFSAYRIAAAAIKEQLRREEAVARARNERERAQRAARTQLRVVPPSDHPVNAEDLSPAQLIENPDPFLKAIGHIQLSWPNMIWHDTFKNDYLTTINGQPASITDEVMLDIFKRLLHREDLQKSLHKNTAIDAVSWVATHDKRNCLQDWLTPLEWDHVPRLATLMHVAWHTENTPLMAATGTNFLLSMVARAMDPGCQVHHMPVFCGAQGVGKTKALISLVPNPDWFSSLSPSNPEKLIENIPGKWLIEIAEMHSFMSTAAATEQIKALISNNVDRFRAPYARRASDHPRQSVWSGTSNNVGWHYDPTGGRRFLPADLIEGTTVDCDYIANNREQLFAEALYLYREGRNWHDYPAEEQAAAVAAHRDVELWEEVIASRLLDPRLYDGFNGTPPVAGEPHAELHSDAHWGSIVTSRRVAQQWLGIPVERANYTPRAIGKIMRRLGWKNQAIRNGDEVISGWKRTSPVVRDVTNQGSDEAETITVTGVVEEDNDIPF